MFADVIVDISVEALDRVFQYRIPPELEPDISVGTQVCVPFGRGNRRLTGFVVGIEKQAAWPEEKIKDLLGVEQGKIAVEGQLLQLAAWMRERYGSTMNEALKTVLPVKKQIKSVEEHWLNFVVPEETARREIDRCLLRHYKAKARFLQGMLAEGGQMTRALASKKYGVSRPVIDGFIKSGFISESSARRYRNPAEQMNMPEKPVVLNPEQRAAADTFARDYDAGTRKTYLLYGVTGSGKTEVYMEMIRHVREQGKQVIVLIPEIALTAQTVGRFRSRFGDSVSVLHSRLSDGERSDQYERAKRGESDIMVGPRSALFVPFENLGLIIVDEEHETSYKSENPPKYHAREAALYRAEMVGASVVLGSATPSVESYQAAKEGRYELLSLPCRAGAAGMPSVIVADLREELRAGNRSVFSRILKEKIRERLRRKEQTILFLNRRGYAGFVSCRNCGFVIKCSHCDISMTAHKNHVGDVDTLVCHYCGRTISMPETCPECGSPYIAAFGLGTQKVEDMLLREFPGARVLRMDGDTTAGKHGHENILEPFRQGRADILIGTQMIVKGHDFPNVTLAAVLAADMGLYAGDYRSGERTFDLLMQASGRAGRGDKPGEVVIQTYNPDQYCIQAVQRQDAEIFYENELAYRRMAGYPPCAQMLVVLVMGQDKEGAKKCIHALAEGLAGFSEKASIIGPAEAGLSRAKDWYRFVMHIKCREEAVIVQIKNELEQISRRGNWEKSYRIQYDRDPLSSY